MARISYKDLLGLYMNYVAGRAGETFVERRVADCWTDKEWAALVELRNEIEELDRQFDEEAEQVKEMMFEDLAREIRGEPTLLSQWSKEKAENAAKGA